MKILDCLKLDEVKSRKNRFQEKLIDITEFQDYQKIVNDERLYTFFHTPAKELAKECNELGNSYKYAFPDNEALMNLPFYKLLDIMLLANKGKIKLYISQNKEIEGLILYTVGGGSYGLLRGSSSYVEDILTISFNLQKNNLTLIKDLSNLIADLRKNHGYIKWIADKSNPAVEFYKRKVKVFQGKYKEDPEDPNILIFWIPGLKKDPPEELEPFDEKFHPIITNDIFRESVIKYFQRRELAFEKEFTKPKLEEIKKSSSLFDRQ